MRNEVTWTGLALLVFLMGVLVSPAQSQHPVPRGSAIPIPAASLGEPEVAQVDAKTESVEALAEWRLVPLEGQGLLIWRPPPAHKSRTDNDPITIYFADAREMSGEIRTFEYSGTNPADALQHLEADLGIPVAENLPTEQPVEELAPSIKSGVPGYWSETVESSVANLGIFTQLIDLNDCKVAIHAASPDGQGAGGAVGAAGTTGAWLGKVICVRSTPWTPWVGGPVNVRSIPTGGGGVNCLWSQSWTRTATFSCGRIVCGLQVWSWDEVRTEKVLKTVSSGPHLPPYTCPALPPGGMPRP